MPSSLILGQSNLSPARRIAVDSMTNDNDSMTRDNESDDFEISTTDKSDWKEWLMSPPGSYKEILFEDDSSLSCSSLSRVSRLSECLRRVAVDQLTCSICNGLNLYTLKITPCCKEQVCIRCVHSSVNENLQQSRRECGVNLTAVNEAIPLHFFCDDCHNKTKTNALLESIPYVEHSRVTQTFYAINGLFQALEIDYTILPEQYTDEIMTAEARSLLDRRVAGRYTCPNIDKNGKTCGMFFDPSTNKHFIEECKAFDHTEDANMDNDSLYREVLRLVCLIQCASSEMSMELAFKMGEVNSNCVTTDSDSEVGDSVTLLLYEFHPRFELALTKVSMKTGEFVQTKVDLIIKVGVLTQVSNLVSLSRDALKKTLNEGWRCAADFESTKKHLISANHVLDTQFEPDAESIRLKNALAVANK
jgi:hypothetical protein